MTGCEPRRCSSEPEWTGTTAQELLPDFEEAFPDSFGKMGVIDLLLIAVSHSVSFIGTFPEECKQRQRAHVVEPNK